MLGLFMSLSGVCAAASGAESSDKVEVWRRKDIVLKSEKKYKNPYTDVDIDAVFTHEDGTKINLYGFWSGGDEWRVRFAPTKTGVWEYVITCTDTENPSLNTSGSLLAVKNTGETDIDKHGFVKVSDNNRYFVHDDGTPFYWLGDTNWQAPNYVSVSDCNYPGCDCGNQFTHEVNNRLEKGFTVYQTYFDSAESDGGGQRAVTKEPSMWSKKYEKINPATFCEKYDYMFDYLADHGMVIALGFGVHTSTVSSMSKNELERLSRYLTARYAAYPVVWITAQEITGEEQFDAWVSSARVTDAGDGYNHPQSAHQYPLESSDTYIKKLDGESWHDFYALQNGHGPKIPKKSTYKGYYNAGKKPFVETEANYEDIYCGGFNGYSASRISAWKANLCGSCGFTYGVTGIWANCRSTAGSTGWLGTFSTEPWYMGLDKPGSYEMKYMADFFRYADFSTLVPRFDNKTYSDFSGEEKVLASSADAKTYAAYFYNTDLSTGTVKGLNKNEKYAAKWYDPLTGAFTLISDDIKVADGTYKIPDKPNGSDWAFIITSRTDPGYCKTASLPDLEVKSNERTADILSGSKAKASSYSAPGSSADKAVDGNTDTWWCASDGSFPQWILFDMKEQREFNSLSLTMYPGTSGISYTVECADDGKTMRTVYSVNDKTPDSPGSAVFTSSLDGTEKCRYIKITFSSVKGNWAAVVEADAYVSETSGATELPSYEGILQTPEVSCVGGCIYDANGNLTDTSPALTDGNLKTEWKPFAYESTQTVLLDMRKEKRVYGLDIMLGLSVSPFDFRVMGSVDGENWSILADTGISGLKTYRSGGRNALSASLSGKYRYVKVILMGAPDKSVKKTVAEIKLYADDNIDPDGSETAVITEQVPVTDTDVTTGDNSSQKEPEKRSNVIPVIIGAVCATAVAAGTVFFVIKKKKGK